ncbi:MAG TPA: hypothetical protein VF789_06980, partial [Thermoanaerobaculia bacterium]
ASSPDPSLPPTPGEEEKLVKDTRDTKDTRDLKDRGFEQTRTNSSPSPGVGGREGSGEGARG